MSSNVREMWRRLVKLMVGSAKTRSMWSSDYQDLASRCASQELRLLAKALLLEPSPSIGKMNTLIIYHKYKFSNENLKSAVNFMNENRGKYPWHKLTGDAFQPLTTLKEYNFNPVIFPLMSQ